ncbi:MAG TPA: hypothetical protein VNK92_05270 [Vicinamibacterales bacterium]|nr:hypothetical protein [Vicinamibacterales bacterium]
MPGRRRGELARVARRAGCLGDAALPALIFGVTLVLRTWEIDRRFWLLGDQIRDWEIALRPFADLPLVGPPTHVGGYTIGPAFYWILWTVRVTLGPWFDNLPHAGGIGQAAILSAADALLFVAVRRRAGSTWIALAAVTLLATAAFDLCLAAMVWNPVVGSALARIATALVLLDWHRADAARAAATLAIAWAAVHAYTGAVFVAVGVFLAALFDPFVRGDRATARRNAIAALIVVSLLQLPYVAHRLVHPRVGPAMGAVTGSLWRVATGRDAPQVEKSVRGYVEAVAFVQGAPWRPRGLGWAPALGGILLAVRRRRDAALLSVTLVPQALAVAGYALFLDDLDHYYYLSLMPSAVLTILLAALPAGRSRLATTFAAATFAAALLPVPARVRAAATMHQWPEYGALLDGSRRAARLEQPLRALTTEFPLPPTTDGTFLYRILGGRLDPRSPWTATIGRDGRVTYRRVEPMPDPLPAGGSRGPRSDR